MLETSKIEGAWSATPTPFTAKNEIDSDSISRLIDHHLNLGIKGVLVAGTCGEGPFLTQKQYQTLAKEFVRLNQLAGSKLILSLQVTANSSEQMLENIRVAEACGIDMVVINDPWFKPGWASPDHLEHYYFNTLDQSPLPVGIYTLKPVFQNEHFKRILLHPKVRLLKDSTQNSAMMKTALEVQREREDFIAMNGDEWNIVTYLKAGYRGQLAGGGIIIGRMMNKMIEAHKLGNEGELWRIQQTIDRLLKITYGGDGSAGIPVELTCYIAAMKYTLFQMNIFSTWNCLMKFPLTDEAKDRIDRMVEDDHDLDFPFIDTKMVNQDSIK